MRHFITLTILIPLLAVSGCTSERHRHLTCTDGDGNTVADTHDLSREPRQFPMAWSWWTTSDDGYHEVSVPPHICRYESHPVPEEGEHCGCALERKLSNETEYAKAP